MKKTFYMVVYYYDNPAYLMTSLAHEKKEYFEKLSGDPRYSLVEFEVEI